MKERKLNMKEKLKYETIEKIIKGKINVKRAMIILNYTERHIYRLIKIYHEKGKDGFIHGNRGRKPLITIDKSLPDNIVQYYQDEYQGFNFNHYKYMLKKDKNIEISYTTIYKILTTENGILSPKARKTTRKKYKKIELLKKKENKTKSEKEINKEVNKIIKLEDSHPRKPRSKYFGEKVEYDASSMIFFGDVVTHLHLCFDDCTGACLGGYFDKQETLNGYYNITYQMLVKYGIPLLIVSDGRTVFEYKSLRTKIEDKDTLTQFQRACKTLGISTKITSIPQKKPRVERGNYVFQDRLSNELKHYGITTIEEANNYLINTFIPEYNKLFSIDQKKVETVMEKSPTDEELKLILSVLAIRKIDNGNSINYKRKTYMVYDKKDNLICFKPGTECTVIVTFEGKMFAQIENKIYKLRELDMYEKNCEMLGEEESEDDNESEIEKLPKPKSSWNSDNVRDFIEKIHEENKIYDEYNPK